MTSSLRLPVDSAPAFDVHVDYRSRRVEIVGELDITTVLHMVDAWASLRTDPPCNITIDLSSVSFIDAGAFGALVGLSNYQHDQGALLHVVGNDRVRWIAALCGLDSLLVSD